MLVDFTRLFIFPLLTKIVVSDKYLEALDKANLCSLLFTFPLRLSDMCLQCFLDFGRFINSIYSVRNFIVSIAFTSISTIYSTVIYLIAIHIIFSKAYNICSVRSSSLPYSVKYHNAIYLCANKCLTYGSLTILFGSLISSGKHEVGFI